MSTEIDNKFEKVMNEIYEETQRGMLKVFETASQRVWNLMEGSGLDASSYMIAMNDLILKSVTLTMSNWLEYLSYLNDDKDN